MPDRNALAGMDLAAFLTDFQNICKWYEFRLFCVTCLKQDHINNFKPKLNLTLWLRS